MTNTYEKIYYKDNFAYLLNKYKYSINPGDIVAGIIKYKEVDGFLVDIGDSIASYLPLEELQLYNKYNKNDKRANSFLLYLIRDFLLISCSIKHKTSIISIKRLEYIRAWKRIKQLYLEDVLFQLKIQYLNRGGIIVSLEGLQGFIPNSYQYNLRKTLLSSQKTISCKLSFINETNNAIILSQKSALLYLSKHKFRLGEIIYGTITNIQNYGIFIDIYGILGLLHISEISSKYISNIYNIFQVGHLIKIKIIHINKKQGRLSVSTKKIYINPPQQL